jgi:hypothetical protein
MPGFSWFIFLDGKGIFPTSSHLVPFRAFRGSYLGIRVQNSSSATEMLESW